MPSDGRACVQQLGFVTWRVDVLDPHVVADVEGGSVDPQRPTEAQPGSEQQLPEALDRVQPRLELPPDLPDPDATVAAEQAAAIHDGEAADVGRPAVVEEDGRVRPAGRRVESRPTPMRP
jgi:hypothetical protein